MSKTNRERKMLEKYASGFYETCGRNGIPFEVAQRMFKVAQDWRGRKLTSMPRFSPVSSSRANPAAAGTVKSTYAKNQPAKPAQPASTAGASGDEWSWNGSYRIPKPREFGQPGATSNPTYENSGAIPGPQGGRTFDTAAQARDTGGNSWAGYGRLPDGGNDPRIARMMGEGTGPNSPAAQQAATQTAEPEYEENNPFAPARQQPAQAAQPRQPGAPAIDKGALKPQQAGGMPNNPATPNQQPQAKAVVRNPTPREQGYVNMGAAGRMYNKAQDAMVNAGERLGRVIGNVQAAGDNAMLRARKIRTGFGNAWDSLKKGFRG